VAGKVLTNEVDEAADERADSGVSGVREQGAERYRAVPEVQRLRVGFEAETGWRRESGAVVCED